MKRIIFICLLIAFIGYRAHGQYRSAAFTVQHEQTEQTVSLGQTFETDGNIELALSSPIYGFSVSGNVTLKDTSNSLIRITLVDSYEMEYLVYEIYPLLTQQWQFDFDNMGFETSNMDEANISKMKISVLNAELTLKEYQYMTEPPRSIQRQQRFKTQQQYIIETLNANLEARDMPWRAGETSVSKLSYEEKKNLFGGTVPNLNGFEYYVGGIFVMPDYQPVQPPQTRANASLVSEWDWRNRHGKNWMTPVKNQGTCESCWAFAVAGTLEAYVNLYYNRLLNLDLSEQQLVSGVHPGTGCSGGNTENAFQFIKNTGIVNESCFPYQEKDVEYSNICQTPAERIWIDSIININYPDYDISDVKRLLFRAPICFGLKSWKHGMVLVGYKTIKQGDIVYYRKDGTTYEIKITKNHTYIGSTAWIFKNSWGTDFGENGYVCIFANMSDMYQTHAICGNIKSQGRSSNDIVISNTDGDPYFFWGISSLPGYDPNLADGNDASAQEGPLDAYGYTMPLASISNTTLWNNDSTINKTIFIQNGGVLNIAASITMSNICNIIVRSGGKLIVNGGTLNNVAIEVESGGHLQIINNGTIHLRNTASLDIKNGGTLDFSSGYIN